MSVLYGIVLYRYKNFAGSNSLYDLEPFSFFLSKPLYDLEPFIHLLISKPSYQDLRPP